MSQQGEPAASRDTLAAKLDHLFHTVRPRDRGEYSYREVAKGVERQGGPTISASYLHELRSGAKDNPTLKHIEGLAKFFGVPPDYFFDDSVSQRVDEQLELLAALRDAGVHGIALRATGLSAQGKRLIADMIERTRELEAYRDGQAE